MINTKLIKTRWYPLKRLVVTQLSGEIEQYDVSQWIKSLKENMNLIGENQNFKILINLHGFEAIDLDTHKKFRVVIPEMLANYGWKTGYVNLFEEAESLKIISTRGINCIAAAHVHHDKSKIEKYDSMFGKINERFFTTIKQAAQWIEQL